MPKLDLVLEGRAAVEEGDDDMRPESLRGMAAELIGNTVECKRRIFVDWLSAVLVMRLAKNKNP